MNIKNSGHCINEWVCSVGIAEPVYSDNIIKDPLLKTMYNIYFEHFYLIFRIAVRAFCTNGIKI